VTTVLPAQIDDFVRLPSGARQLLIGVSVFREPVERTALLFQLGGRGLAAARRPGVPGPAPGNAEPAELDELLAACASSGLLTVAPGARADRAPDDQAQIIFVDPRVADELHRLLPPEERGQALADAHRRAADYYQWRSAAWPAGREAELHDLLTARQHLFEAGETRRACELTEVLCGQLHASRSLGQEADLVRDTLRWLPDQSTDRADWLRELGKIAEVQRDYAAAERCYQQALELFGAAGNQVGVSRSYHSLGVLAQAQGDYAKAEQRYEQAARSGSAAPQPPPEPGPEPASYPGRAGDQADARPASAVIMLVADRQRRRQPARWLLTTGTAAVVAAIAISVAGISATLSARQRSSSAPSGPVLAEITRRDAATWVMHHTSRSTIVACDPAMCLALEQQGMPSGNLVALGPGSPDPLGANLVIATVGVRSQFGARLARVYAPVVAASFGTGGERIAVRVVAPDGSAAYWRALGSDLLARRSAGAQLVRNPRIAAAPAARSELAAGLVDARVLVLLAALAARQPLRIASFGGAGPGASSGLPLPEVILAGPRHGPDLAYLRRLLTFVRAQRPPYLAFGAHIGRLRGGRLALRILFAEPGPLGLLGPAGPGR
jgi:tetratricopeptide (TPR) repeat protein